MKIIKFLLLGAFTTAYFAAAAQKSEPVFLKWKIKPGDSLNYKTIMEVDTASQVNWNTGGMFKSMGIDSANAGKMKEIFKELNGAAQLTNLVTTLAQKHKGLIDVIMLSKPAAPQKNAGKPLDIKASSFQEMARSLTGGVMLRGVLNEDGSIASFYTANAQKNVLAIFFELPGKAVKEGDSWPLNVNLIAMAQNFTCDSAFKKNEVKVLKIENKNNQHLVTLKYDIEEYVSGNMINPFDSANGKTTMDYKFEGLAVFSVEKGKWVSFDGVITNAVTGFMGSKSKTRYALIEE